MLQMGFSATFRFSVGMRVESAVCPPPSTISAILDDATDRAISSFVQIFASIRLRRKVLRCLLVHQEKEFHHFRSVPAP
ncbi:hypothetical protein TNCT_714551 [Trichonephila clavata]|uniref:Uncharacterized protein n=1 Tax=Trichonephila clavata TaxID=2740835 RepID=A0A8X6M0K7_TRICU|nr:hypothetical protein TNCT_714551 [Trichonephila clavata]